MPIDTGLINSEIPVIDHAMPMDAVDMTVRLIPSPTPLPSARVQVGAAAPWSERA